MTDHQSARRRSETLIRPTAGIVPEGSIAGRSLMAVVAIMTFLAALTAGTVQLLGEAANQWGSEVAREVTVQVRPTEGTDLDAQVARAVAAARSTPGIGDVLPWSREESERALEPWLGSGLNLNDLPVPRLIVIRPRADASPDFAALRLALSDIPGASLDDHRFWIASMATVAQRVVIAGLGILALMITATALSVVFATRGAMSGNRDVVEVLHFVGAHDSFIAAEFQSHFLWLGLKGGLIGGGAAGLFFALAHLLASRFAATPAGEQLRMLFGSFAMDWKGYAAITATVVLVSLITGLTSRLTVHYALRNHA